jgi:hypothetical protein
MPRGQPATATRTDRSALRFDAQEPGKAAVRPPGDGPALCWQTIDDF